MPEIKKNRRFPAEWEQQSAVQITFPHEHSDWADSLEEVLPCFVHIATTIARFELVIVVCADAEKTQSLLKHIPTARLKIIQCPSNDTWARDHAGIVVEENGQFVVLDFVFNGWGLKFPADKDNLITTKLAAMGLYNASVHPGGIVLEGGALESDGQGSLLTTAECLLSPNRNPHLSKDQIESYLKGVFGLDRVLWLNHGYLAGDDTDSHIDTLARFCHPDVIAYVKCPDPGDEHFDSLQKMEDELKSFTQASGLPYTLVPLPWPDSCLDASGNRLPATYANFLIINGAVLVPTYNVRQDQEAIAVFKTIFPTHEIVGVDCRPLIEQHGSLHCITMQYPAGTIHLKS